MNNIIHIIQHTARAATVLLLALLATAQGAWAQTPSGNWDTWVNDNNIDWSSADAKAAAIPQSDDGSTVYISTAEQLAYYAYAVNNDKQISGSASGYYCGRTVELMADIDLSEHYWKPIGWNKDYYFSGYFHGNGHVITGIHVNGDPKSDNTNNYPCYGLFGYFHTRSGGTSTITDLVLKDFSITASFSGNNSAEFYLGGLVGRCDDNTAITNCLLVNGSVSKSGNNSHAHIGKVAGAGSPSAATANYYHNVSVSGWYSGYDSYALQTIGGETEARAVALTISSTHGSVALGGTVGRISGGIIYAPANETVTLNTTTDAGYIASLAATGLTLTSGQFTMPDNNDGTITATIYKLLIHDEITVTIPSQTYNGMPLTPAVTITDANEGSAKTLTEGEDFDIISGTCTNAGDYNISIQGRGNYKGERTEVFTIAKAAINPTLVIQDKTYNGEEITYTIENNPGGGQVTMFSWEKENSDNSWSGVSDTPKDAGKYRGTAVIAETDNYQGANTNTAEFTIAKATPTVNAPTPIENLVYTGSAQALVNAGSTDFGTLLYSLDGTNYSTDIPTGTAAGTYTVYYKVEGSDNWNAVDAQTVEVTIAPRNYTVTFDANGGEGTMEPMQLTYDGDWTALTANTFTRSGYGFNGWNTKADGSGTAYRDEEWVRNLTDEANGNVMLFAQWGKDITTCTATVPDQTMGGYSYIYYKFETANNNAELAAEMGVVVKDGDEVLTLGTDYEFGNVTFADGSDGMPASIGDECLLEIRGKGKYAGSLWAPFTITVADAGGTWGELAWAFHAGTLTISGTGAMNAASDYSGYPWFSVASNVKTITIGEGVTTIADAAFAGTSQINYYSHVATASLPTTLTAIGDDAFAYCNGLTIAIPSGVTISSSAFYQVGRVVGTLSNAADNTDIIGIMAAAQSADVQLQGRTLYKDGSWNTLCLPFDISTASGTLSGDGVQAMTLNTTTSSLTDGTLTLNFTAAETIPAGTPFIIKWDESGTDIENPVFEDVTIDATNRDATVTGVLTFTGTYAPVTIGSEGDNTKLYLGSDNTLYYPNAAMTIGTHRAYFQLADGITAGEPASLVRAFVLNFVDDEATGIITTNSTNSTNSSNEWYSLDGRKLDGQPTAKGLYIHGGKKVAIK